MPDEVCISKHWSSCTKCEIFRGQCPLAPKIWAYEKAAFEWVETLVPFLPFVDQNSPNLVGMYGSDRSLQCRFQIDDILLQSGDICNEVIKWHSWKLSLVFLAVKFSGKPIVHSAVIVHIDKYCNHLYVLFTDATDILPIDISSGGVGATSANTSVSCCHHVSSTPSGLHSRQMSTGVFSCLV